MRWLLYAYEARAGVFLERGLLAKSLAKSMGGTFNRVQFTPNLMPANITGFNVYDQQSAGFSFRPGPVITLILLANEINRTIPRTQPSLLECMEERQVTVDGKTHLLPSPFIVMAIILNRLSTNHHWRLYQGLLLEAAGLVLFALLILYRLWYETFSFFSLTWLSALFQDPRSPHK